MSETKAFPGHQLGPGDYENFKADVQLLLSVFTAQRLANWMGKDKGNFSKKINGVDPVTPKFLQEFYRVLGPAITRIRQGASSHEVVQEMNARPKPEDLEILIRVRAGLTELQTRTGTIQLEIMGVQTALAEQAAAIRKLEAAVFRPEGSSETG